MKQGGVVVISGPSGVGKTTLYKRLLQEMSDRLAFSVSATTRQARVGETNGVDYYFFSREEFKAAIEAGRFAEWAEVYGNYYGTLKSEIGRIKASGKTALLDLDVQGGMSIQKAFSDALLIFILPPSLEALRERIVRRCSDDPESIKRRLQQAHQEMEISSCYDCLIENVDIEETYEKLRKIVEDYVK